MNRKFAFVLILFILTSCSFNKNSKIWNEKDNKFYSKKNIKKILTNKESIQKEFNAFVELDFSNLKIKNINKNHNNNGSLEYLGLLKKISSYKFSKFKNSNKLNLEPFFLDDGIIFFDKKGSIIKYNFNQKIIWKKNFYSKSEKKLKPKLSFAIQNEKLIIADSIAKIYQVNLDTGDLIWSKKNDYPLNSEIKILNDKFFLVDYQNTLRCFIIMDGSNCWNFKTENSFTISNQMNSIIIHKNNVIFNNSIGDVTSVDIFSGMINWQLPTQSSKIINQTYNFKTSKLVTDGKNIYFSNNKDQFFSIDIETGIVNWINNISSSLTPILIQNYIITVSKDGYLFFLQKNEGNIIKINDTFGFYKKKHRKKIEPRGFVVGLDKLYLTNDDGKIIVIKLKTGEILKIHKISRNNLSKPFIHKKNLFVIKNGSINQYN